MPKHHKITDSHSTLTKPSEKVMEEAAKISSVSKISISIIKQVGGGRRSLKFLPITGGIKAVVRGEGAVQELFIYTDDPVGTEEKLKGKWKTWFD